MQTFNTYESLKKNNLPSNLTLSQTLTIVKKYLTNKEEISKQENDLKTMIFGIILLICKELENKGKDLNEIYQIKISPEIYLPNVSDEEARLFMKQANEIPTNKKEDSIIILKLESSRTEVMDTNTLQTLESISIEFHSYGLDNDCNIIQPITKKLFNIGNNKIEESDDLFILLPRKYWISATSMDAGYSSDYRNVLTVLTINIIRLIKGF